MAETSMADGLRKRIDSHLAKLVKDDAIPGLTAAVVCGGDTVYAGAHGVRRIDGTDELRPRHIFHFASVSKPFVATAIMQLIEQNRLSLDTPVTRILPYFSLSDMRFRDITILQMLNHTSGMPDVEDYEWNSPQFDEGAAERYVRSIAGKSLLWAPGSAWQYSNMAFDTLGDVIAKASGMTFEAYIQNNIFEPLRMHTSSFIYPEIDDLLRTTGHVGQPAKASTVYPYNRRHAPSSTLNSSVAEMARWMLCNLNRGELGGQRILQAESYDVLWAPTADTSYDGVQIGLSWFIGQHAGRRTVFHGGGDVGFRSDILLLPDDDIGIVLACNWDGTTAMNGLAAKILDLVLESPAL